MQKTVYAFDAFTSAFAGPVELDESDLSPLEEGVFLVPGNCLEVAPPAAPDGSWPYAMDGGWQMRPLPVEPEAEQPPAPTFEQRAAALLASVDAHLNKAAQARGYDDRNTFYMRAAVPASPFYPEGLVFATWMDAVYAKCYEVIAVVQSGAMAEPTQEQLLALLPVLNLPEPKGA